MVPPWEGALQLGQGPRKHTGKLEPLGVHSRAKYLNIANTQYDAPCTRYYTNSDLVIPTTTTVGPFYREGKGGK